MVYHSVFFMYPPPQVRQAIGAAVEAAGRDATPGKPLAWLRYEMEGLFDGDPASGRQILDLVTWPGGVRRVLAEVDNAGQRVVRLDAT